MKSKIVSVLLILSMILAFSAPAYAEQAAEQKLEIRIKAGSTQMKVNGQAVKITAPYAANGTTMVPMAVFTKGLGAKLTPKDKQITLVLGKHTVVLTTGSKSATADGKKLTLAAAPVVKSGLAFAPVKVAESLGAKVKVDASTKETVITATVAAAGNASGGSAIDSDAGKSKIGDSYYQWSINYPTGLVQDFQSDEGDSLIFRDVKNEYYLGIFVEQAKDALTSEDIRDKLYDYFDDGDKVVDKQTVNGSGGLSYEKMTTKNTDGFYYEFRGYQANGNFYAVIFGKKAASMSELRRNTGILDSFKPAYDKNDKTLKNVAKILSDTKTLKNEDYGLSLTLPKEWSVDKEASKPWFYTDDAYLYLDVSSLVQGDTVDAWIDRKMKRYEDYFAAAYRKAPEVSGVTWNGIPAKMVKLSYSQDTKTWWEEYEIFAVKGNYRYYTEFAYAEKKKPEYGALIHSLLQSMKVDFKTVEGNFGNIPDESDMQDYSATVTKTNEEWDFGVTVPKHWSEDDSDSDEGIVNYYFPGGSMTVMVFEEMSDPQAIAEQIRKEALKSLENTENVKIVEDTKVTFAGESAIKLIVEDSRNQTRSPNLQLAYILVHQGNVYLVEGDYNLANATDFVKNQLDAALNSFKFTN
ncbi:hypothetical protein GE107_20450 [Cohnella sp. CFH 77786]|uniref:copper amine oxidase N-terminal domain-containing protein n=1 Tax=Cohnella sp. CFH 77786 TaxID=2662265 RepID=UPI001C61105F|nr:copper amine oxidase N-terminal domain-containing protein [Cohnella sp. CFH 77786]MBW5448419.1 hypothetical protein [Cohnella sp. CFH 77786]